MNASSPPRKQQIPVIVLAGFLGSGKTTLLNHLLRNRAGNRIGVIVNDFGAIEIDAMTVSGQVGSTVSLGNGCLCCAVDASELDTFLETLTGPAARLDVIVIEASGLAEPQELVRMILASENPHIVYGGLVEVVDAAEFDATRERHPEIDRHLAVADLVVLNKTDRAGNEEQTRVQDVIAAAAAPGRPGAAVIRAMYGRIDPELLFDPALRPDGEEKARQLTFEDLLRDRSEEEAGEGGHAHHLHAAYDSVSFTADVPMNPHAADGVPRLPAAGPLPDQGIRRLRRGRPGQQVRPARGRQVPAVRPAALGAWRATPDPAGADRLGHRPRRPAQGAGRLP